ncbi:hypothetical protein HY993_01785 [Candidatus Micrarchaeota archaeon]|nr:hypothetical protein [Candidatus Micrarchaeota archaeon]
MQTQEILEEKTRLAVPKPDGDPFHKSAFFNPLMEFNRSAASLAFHAAGKQLGKKMVFADGLCATGPRGLRFLNENPAYAKKCFFVDANEDVIPLLEKNIELNNAGKKSVVVSEGFNTGLKKTNELMDWIELDPFGSSLDFLQTSFNCLSDGGFLSVTGTDLATLCAAKRQNVEAAGKTYGCTIFRNDFVHEMALRVLVGKVISLGEKNGFRAVPKISFFQGHAIKTILECRKSGASAGVGKKIGFVNECVKCLEKTVSKTPIPACSCGARNHHAGPLWLGELIDGGFAREMIAENEKRGYKAKKALGKLLELLLGEQGFPPYCFSIHAEAGRLKASCPKKSFVLEQLRGKGFKACEASFGPKLIKTNASRKTLREIILSGRKEAKKN